MVDVKDELAIAFGVGCDSAIADAIRQFKGRWQPYSASSRRYPIVRLIQDLIDPTVTAYMASLASRYLGYFPGAATGIGLSEIIRSVGLDATVRLQRQLLRQFIKTADKQSEKDRRFVATLETLIELVWDCACKRPVKSKVRDTQLNGERSHGFCRFCGSLAELTSFIGGSDAPKEDDPEDTLRLSDLYCLRHRPKFSNGAWNPAYRQAKRSLKQFDLELSRLRRQCAKRSVIQSISGDRLIDLYIFLYVLDQLFTAADEAELRDQARRMVDLHLSDRKKQMLTLQWLKYNQSDIARKLDIKRQAVSKALASVPEAFQLRVVNEIGQLIGRVDLHF